MKRTLLFLLIVIVAAGVLGTLASRDPGYVLLSYDGATLQTGLWVFLAGLVLAGVLIWSLYRLWQGLFAGAARLQRWRKDRSVTRSLAHSTRGLLYLEEGNPERAEKFLLSGTRQHPMPLMNYLHLARAANQQNKPEEREKYFRLALEGDSKAGVVVALTRAELALEREDWSACVAALADVSSNPRALRLKQAALIGAGNWNELGELLPALKKVLAPSAYRRLEEEYLANVLTDESLNPEQKLKSYRSVSADVQANISVLVSLAENVDSEKELEGILRKAIKQSWQPELVAAYAEIGEETLQKRLKTALAWQKQHPVDPALSYCIGHLQEMAGQLDEAIKHYEVAIAQGGYAAASKQLANLYAQKGDINKSHEYLSLAYRGA